MIDINSQHAQMVNDLLHCAPGTERARELRAMIRRLEGVDRSLEQRRIEAMSQEADDRLRTTVQEAA